MSLHRAEIQAILSRWLERYSPPAMIRENPRAQQDEADALLSVLVKFAPRSEPGPWVHRALDRLEYQMKTRAWPTKGELGSVCSNLRKERPTDIAGEGADMRPEAVAARLMQAGKHVGEGWLYGRLAVEMIAAQLVDRETMERYRSAAFLSRKATQGEAAALAWEADAKARHDEARRLHADRERHQRDVRIPDRALRPPEDFAA